MRYQERIYIQNENDSVRNKDILNFNMSSDMCIFESPTFNLSGASKIDCSASTITAYSISTATTIPLTFQFTGNTASFSANSASFKYEIYKFSSDSNSFMAPPVIKSQVFDYSGFSGTSSISENVPISGLSLDGDYLVKGYYTYDICTKFLNSLGKKIDTLTYRNGREYSLYEPDTDYAFVAVRDADEPILTRTSSNTPPANQLFQQIMYQTTGTTDLIITNNYSGYFILTLNGLTLSPQYDYTISGSIITLSAATVSGDIVTLIYTTSGGNNLTGDNIPVIDPVVSGATDGEGTNVTYYNTTTGKYELYTSVTPILNSDLIVMINGVILAKNIDYYQSITNPKRIILEGDILVGDLIMIAYFARTNVINGLITNNPLITWTVENIPQTNNGFFNLEVSTGNTFSNFYYTGTTNYVKSVGTYSDTFVASGSVGTYLYYRVKNNKNYETLCGDIVSSTAYSETIPLLIESNSINSY